ncbi:MAG: DUF805 domain-containing protein [Prevotella sp.]|nr:DUF805 domain-containing protein [Prevotella sp.]
MNAKPTMGFVEAIKTCYAKYFNFNGRARRSEFWWFYLFASIFSSIPVYIVNMMHTAAAAEFKENLTGASFDQLSNAMQEAQAVDSKYMTFYIIAAIISLVLFTIPLIAAMARRLHDVGKSGWLILCILLCGIGVLIPLIMCIPDGKPEPNKFGPSPKYVPTPGV